jgi:uncharacterized membrane protein YphA (DoxX/SURF4 family)
VMDAGDLAFLSARILLAALFLYSGIEKLL